MLADEIRASFGHNAVFSTGRSGFPESDTQELQRLVILAIGELAAQLAEANLKNFVVR